MREKNGEKLSGTFVTGSLRWLFADPPPGGLGQKPASHSEKNKSSRGVGRGGACQPATSDTCEGGPAVPLHGVRVAEQHAAERVAPGPVEAGDAARLGAGDRCGTRHTVGHAGEQ